MKHEIGIEASIECILTDSEGKIVRVHKQEFRSWVWNFARAFLFWLGLTTDNNGQLGCDALKDSGATDTMYLSSTNNANNPIALNAPATEDTAGLILGVGDTAVTKNDYDMDTKIAHGTGSGELNYGATTVDALVEDGNKISRKLTRTFTNGSGGTIVVKECGLMSKNKISTSYVNFLMSRDVLLTPQAVPNSMTLTIRIDVSYTFA